MSAPPSPRPINSAAASVRIAPLAYVKAILHACAHPARPVLGVLLASKSGEVVDVVPAFHSNPLAPSLEIAFLLIEEFALRRELSIAGVYAGNELDSDGAALTAWPRLVGEKIAEQTNSVPHALMIQNIKLAKNEMAFKCFTLKNQHWIDDAAPAVNRESVALAAIISALRAGCENRLADLEQHLSAPASDWTNVALDAELKNWL